MTLTDAPPAPRADQRAGAAGGGRRRRLRILAIVCAAALVAAGSTVAVIHAVDAAALAQVHVYLDARPFSCARASDATTTLVGGTDLDDDESDAMRVPAVKAGPALDCRMSIIVRNDSDRDVDVDRIRLPLFGPANGTGVHADRILEQGLRPIGGRNDVDAVFDLVHDPQNSAPFPVSAVSIQRFDVQLSWSDGCEGVGSSTSFTEAPTVTASIGTATVDLHGEGAGYAVVGTAESHAGC